MRAALNMGSGIPVDVRDVESLPVGPREARVRVDASGVCHTDLLRTRRPGPMSIMGHEGAGTVVEVGRQVSRLRVGDRVIASFAPVCGHCFYCARGESTQCEETARVAAMPRALVDGNAVVAMSGLGTWAQEMVVPEISLVPVRTDLPAEQLALIGCGVTTGVGAALWSARVRPGSTVTVYGCGGVGIFAVQGARIAGAGRIFVVDPNSSKRAAAAAVGATDLIDPALGDPVEQIRDLTEGRGTDYAFEVVGLASTIVQAYETARPRGMAIVVGMGAPDATVTLPAGMMFHQEKRLIGSFYGSAQVMRDMPLLVALAERGRLDIGAAVSRCIALDDVNQAFVALESGDVLRSVILPN